MRVNVMRGLFQRQRGYRTTDDTGESVCHECGALVRDQAAHSDFHDALRQVAHDAENAEHAANQRGRFGW